MNTKRHDSYLKPAQEPARLLMLEFLIRYEERNETAMYFPFLKGLARDCGVPSLWLYYEYLPKIAWDKPHGRTLRACLPEKDLAVLRDRIRNFNPTHVLMNEIPDAPMREMLDTEPIKRFLVVPDPSAVYSVSVGEYNEEMTPHVAVVCPHGSDPNRIYRAEWFSEWLGYRHPLAKEHILDATLPDYEAEQGGKEPVSKVDCPVVLIGGKNCFGRPLASENPRFANVDFGGCAPAACSFCQGFDDRSISNRHSRSPLELAELQLRRIHETDPANSRSLGTYIVQDLGLFLMIDRFFDMVIRNGYAPAQFMFCPRIDDVLNTRERIETVLPLAAANGHRIRLNAMGIENFSEEVMKLYNKNITVAQVDELFALTEKWNKEWPGVFLPYQGGKSWMMLLFTPWTTIADLRINLEEAALRGFESNQLWLCSSLLLRRDTGLSFLAETEGNVIVPQFEDRGQLFFLCIGLRNIWGSIPWRFKDPGAADFFHILVRVFASIYFPESRVLFGMDPDMNLYTEIFMDTLGKEAGSGVLPPWTVLDVALKLLDLFENAEYPWSCEALLREAVAAAKKEVSPAPVSFSQSEYSNKQVEDAPTDRLRIIFRDKTGSNSGFVFHLSGETSEEPAFRVVGQTRIVHDACDTGTQFRIVSSVVLKAAQQIGSPPVRAEHSRWESLVRDLMGQTLLAGKFEIYAEQDLFSCRPKMHS